MGFLLTMIVCSTSKGQAPVGVAKTSNIKLEEYGWQHHPLWQPSQRKEWHDTPGQLIAVDSRGRVLVGFASRQDNDLATRDHPGLSFHILRFTPDGKVDISLVLPTDDYFTNGIYLGANDQILARANGALSVYDGNGIADQNSGWRFLAACQRDCYIGRSYSGRTLLLRTSVKPFSLENLTYTIFDLSLSPPNVRRACAQMADYGIRITDKFEYQYKVEDRSPRTLRFPLCDPNHPQEASLGWLGIMIPISDDNFLSLEPGSRGSLSRIRLIGSDGRNKFINNLPKSDDPVGYLGGAWLTADERGDRFALMISTFRGGSRFFDISSKLAACRVVVYTSEGRLVASIPVHTNYQGDFDFALSPDGHRLAILESGLLTVAELE
jgi:hypothetical protein